jgi:hypothetical protein
MATLLRTIEMSMSNRDNADGGHLMKASEVPVGPESFPKTL